MTKRYCTLGKAHDNDGVAAGGVPQHHAAAAPPNFSCYVVLANESAGATTRAHHRAIVRQLPNEECQMRQVQWLNTARHWIGSALHWDAVKAAMMEQETEFEWVIAYKTAGGFCCLYKNVALDFVDIEDLRAWADEVGVRVYFIGL